jgi:uncharacterized protein YfdQ (DUF2303 family)
MVETPNSSLRELFDRASSLAQPNVLFDTGDVTTFYLPRNGKILSFSSEPFEASPSRKRGTIDVFDVGSLNLAIAANREDSCNVVVYIRTDVNDPSIVAILNDHGPNGPGWRDFRVAVKFQHTTQWSKWLALDGKMVDQETFAEFIEDNIADIDDPPGAVMLEVASHIQATRTGNFRSARSLSNGTVQFQNVEDIDTRVGASSFDVPEKFTLALAPLMGTPLYRVPARFRYRLNNGKLTLGFKLQRVEDLMKQIFDDFAASIVRDDGIVVLEGIAPESGVVPLTPPSVSA